MQALTHAACRAPGSFRAADTSIVSTLLEAQQRRSRKIALQVCWDVPRQTAAAPVLPIGSLFAILKTAILQQHVSRNQMVQCPRKAATVSNKLTTRPCCAYLATVPVEVCGHASFFIFKLACQEFINVVRPYIPGYATASSPDKKLKTEPNHNKQLGPPWLAPHRDGSCADPALGGIQARWWRSQERRAS